MSEPPTMAFTRTHTHRYTLHTWKQPVLSVRAKLFPLCFECSWRDRLERKETKCERCDFLHLCRNNRSIYRKRTSAHFCSDKSHKLFSTCTFNKQKGRGGGESRFVLISICQRHEKVQTSHLASCNIITPKRKWLRLEIKTARAGLLFYIFHY